MTNSRSTQLDKIYRGPKQAGVPLLPVLASPNAVLRQCAPFRVTESVRAIATPELGEAGEQAILLKCPVRNNTNEGRPSQEEKYQEDEGGYKENEVVQGKKAGSTPPRKS